MKTVLITGCSSGYGLETARHFVANGWKVLATMRAPDVAVLSPSENLRILPLDVTSEESIAATVVAAGRIDALVNNAGIGVVGAFEATPLAHIKKVFDTNTFGVMAMCQAVIPQMRARRSGVIVNVTSTVTMKSFPLAAAYKASKQAIDGFTQSLADELACFGIRTKMVEPGHAPTTKFTVNNSIDPQELIPEAYAGLAAPIFAEFGKPQLTTKEADVAQAIWVAVHDTSGLLRFPAGEDAVELAKNRAV